jgi:steroid delta-isomerase-like uncharacterized protein
MSTATNKAIVRQYVQQMLNGGRYDHVEDFMSENVVLHGTGIPAGLEPLKQWFIMFHTAFPDQHTTIDEVVAEEDKVVIHTTVSGTHLGELEGIPATGKSITQTAITIFRLANGKIVEGWFASDNLKLMQQLGVIPAPETA